MARPRRTRPQRGAAIPGIARLGQSFAHRRVELRLTQQTLAELAGVSRSTIQSIEYGAGTVKLSSVVEIADVLGFALEPMTIADSQARR